MTIADTSGLLALFNAREPSHQTIRSLVENLTTPLVVSPFVVAELDYLVATRLGVADEVAILNELSSGAYDLPNLEAGDLRTCAEIVTQYHDQAIGVTDASLVVLADRYETTSILTLDHRHFSVIKPLAGGHFTLPRPHHQEPRAARAAPPGGPIQGAISLEVRGPERDYRGPSSEPH